MLNVEFLMVQHNSGGNHKSFVFSQAAELLWSKPFIHYLC